MCCWCVFLQVTTKESSTEERLTPVALAQQAAQLKQQLVSAHLDSLLGPNAHINLTDPDGALAKWVTQHRTWDGGGVVSVVFSLVLVLVLFRFCYICVPGAQKQS